MAGAPHHSPAHPDGGGPPWRSPGVAVAATAALVIAGVAAGWLSAALRPGPPARGISVVADSVRSITLLAPPGRLVITGEPANHLAAPGRITLAGTLNWSGHRAAIAAPPRQSGHHLRLAYRCAAGSPCSGDLRLTVPEGTAIDVDQPSGQMTLTALAGPLRITAHSVDITAARLRCPDLDATITSGHISASFDTAPRRLAVSLVSAQGTVRLPAGGVYRLSQQVTAGYLQAAIRQAPGAARTITARIDSGSLELISQPAAVTSS
jgi:Toastrack DUF4097